jgi:hypothetical protein
MRTGTQLLMGSDRAENDVDNRSFTGGCAALALKGLRIVEGSSLVGHQ